MTDYETISVNPKISLTCDTDGGQHWTFEIAAEPSVDDENYNWAGTFKCPDCGHSVFEEIKVNVTTAGNVTCVDGTGVLDYGGWDYLGGFVVRFECESCDYSLTDEDGRTITDPYELREYLMAQVEGRKGTT